jgi:iron(III) transport system substrate-binding protein
MLSFFVIVAGLLTLALAPAAAQGGGVVNIYSSRHYGAIEAPFEAFTAATGIQIRVSQGSPQALLERLRAEGEFSPADLFLVIDAGVLSLAAEEGLLQPVESDILTANIPESQRDPNNLWFGLSQRVRTIVYNPATVDPAATGLDSYEDLADPQWNGRLCLRPGSHIYSISLTGSLIHNLGAEAAAEVVAGIVANNPTYIDSDTRILETIEAGGCDVGITNHYYLARKLSENPDFPVRLLWANQGEDQPGAFYNVQGAGVTASALNVDNAIRFIEFMSTVEGQAGTPAGFPGSNFEFPTNPAATLNDAVSLIVEQSGEVRLDTEFALWTYGSLQQQAIDLLESAGYGMSES